MNIVFYLINLDDSKDRLRKATQQLQKDNVNYVRISAVDGRGRAAEDFSGYDSDLALRYMGRPMKGGEMGCYGSHLEAISLLLESRYEFAVVIEDDVLWPQGTKEKIIRLLSHIYNEKINCDIINLGFNKNKIFTSKKEFGDFSLVHAHYFPMTTTCIIWSREGAKRFKESQRKIYAPIDNTLREWQVAENRGYATMPPLVSITNAASEIDALDISKRAKKDRDSLYRLKKHWRLVRQKTIAYKNKILKAS